MKLYSLKAQSFLAFREGVSVNFDKIGPGLIALVGENGSGKSTLLELLFTVLYRSCPSRKSALTDLAHGSREAFIEATFDEFRAKVVLDGHTRKSEAYLYENGKPISNGKLPSYDEAVRERFGPPEMWLASILAAQRHNGDFLRAPKSERKAIFAEMLGLGGLQELHEAAKARGISVASEATVREGVKVEIETRASLMEGIDDEVEEIEKAISHNKERLSIHTGQRDASQEELSDLRIRKEQASGVRARMGALLAKEAILMEELTSIIGKPTKLEAEASESRLAARKLYEGLLADEDTGTRAKERDAAERILTIRKVVDVADATLRILRAELKVKGEELALEELNHERLHDRVRDAAILQNVPCDFNEAPYSECKFLTNAKKAREGLPEMDAEIAVVEALRKEVKGLQESDVRLDKVAHDAMEELESLHKQATDLRGLAARAGELAGAKARIKEIEADLAVVKEESSRRTSAGSDVLSTSRGEIDKILAARIQENWDHNIRVHREIEEKKKEYAAVSGESEGLETIDADIIRATQEYEASEAAMEKQRTLLDEVTEEMGRLRGRMKAKVEDCEKLSEIGKALSGLYREMADWRLLTKALGKDGIQALEIDAAGPEVSGIANELLRGCYGPRFSIRFETTAEKRDGGTKEVFEVRILDDGQDRLVEDLSGGQEVIIRESLSLALAIFNSRRSGRKFETLFRDETAGALDPDHAQRYVQMLRKALDVGGFHQLLFVSHAPAVWEQADARILVANGTAKVEHG